MGAPTPPVIPQPFADDGTKNVIPNTTGDTQRASYQLGFPPRTMQPIDAGGAPMLGPDMNGILNAVTQWLFALQAGQLRTFDEDVSDAVGGYALGAIVLMADGAGYWINIQAGNTSDPDAGGDNWRPVYAYGPADVSGLTGGERTLTAVEASRPLLMLTGVLASNQQIILPPAYQSWLVVNATTGAFSLTVKTQAGSGVDVPQGGTTSPTAVYCDGVNIQRIFVPSALPTSVAPTPETIVLRDNLGRQFALTAAVGTRTTQVATTAFANPAGNGTTWRQNSDGTIDQWGVGQGAGANRTVIFPVAFPNAVLSVQLTPRRASGDALGQVPTIIGSPGLSSFTYAPPDGSTNVEWRVLGR